jgi:alanine racemase
MRALAVIKANAHASQAAARSRGDAEAKGFAVLDPDDAVCACARRHDRRILLLEGFPSIRLELPEVPHSSG